MGLLIGNGKAKVFFALSVLLVLMVPLSARADIYKCTKAGSVSYQETPCEGANVKSAHIEVRDSFVGCFATVEQGQSHIIEVRANGAGTYQLIDERNPLGSGVVLKQATSEELAAMSAGLHIRINNGLDRNLDPGGNTVVYYTRFNMRYVTRSAPVAQPINSASLYGIYKGSNSEGRPIRLLFLGGGVPQEIEKTTCPAY